MLQKKKHIKKLRVWLCLLCCCTLLCGISLEAYASDEDGQFYGSFLGEEYPIYYDYSEPSISLSSPVSGYSYELYYYSDDTTYVKYNNGVTLSDSEYRKFSVIVCFPDVIPSGSVVNITVSGSYSGSTSGFDSVYLKLRDSSQTTLAYKSSNFDVSTYQNYYTVCWDGVEIKGDVDRLMWQFCCTPTSVNWGMYVTSVDITVVSQTDQNLSNIDNNVSGILSYIKNLPSNIASSIKGFFDNVVNAVTSVYNAVTALPAQIKESLTSLFENLRDTVVSALTDLGNFVVDGIKDLFLPSDGYFENVSNDLQDYFEGKLGFLGSVGTLVIDIMDCFIADATPTISFPGFSWNGVEILGVQDVQIIPDSMVWIIDYIHTVTNIIMTGWVLHLALTKYNKVVQG